MTEEENKEAARQRAKKHYQVNKDKKKAYQEANKEKIATNKRKYFQENKEKFNKRNKKYYNTHKEEIIKRRKKNKKPLKEFDKIKQREYYRLKHNKKMASDPFFKLKKNIRTAIGEAFRKSKHNKTCKTVEILGCTFQKFKDYIEKQFESWMTWDNHGLYNGQFNYGWDLDHIIPISEAKTKEDIIRLSHHTNFQPLCSYKNRVVKRNKKTIMFLC